MNTGIPLTKCRKLCIVYSQHNALSRNTSRNTYSCTLTLPVVDYIISDLKINDLNS
jgi:hypothetical protein